MRILWVKTCEVLSLVQCHLYSKIMHCYYYYYYVTYLFYAAKSYSPEWGQELCLRNITKAISFFLSGILSQGRVNIKLENLGVP